MVCKVALQDVTPYQATATEIHGDLCGEGNSESVWQPSSEVGGCFEPRCHSVRNHFLTSKCESLMKHA